MKIRRLMAGLLAGTLLLSPLPAASGEEVTLGSYQYVGARSQEAAATAELLVRGLSLTQDADEPVEVPALAGAEFGVYVADADGQMRPWANPLYPQEPMRVRSGEEAVRFALPSGQQFYLRQESAPAGYLPMQEEYLPIEAGMSIEVVNAMAGEVCVSVTDTAGAPLAGAGVRLSGPDGRTVEAETDASGTLTFGGLAEGAYTIEEIRTPAGAVAIAQTAQTVQVGQAARARVSFVHPQKGRLILTCALREAGEDGQTHETPLSGLMLELTGPEGTVQLETDADGMAVVSLAEGSYRARVLNAPEGCSMSAEAFEAVVANEQETPVSLTVYASGGRVAVELEAPQGAGAAVTLRAGEQTYGPFDVEDGLNVTDVVPAGVYALEVSEVEAGFLPAYEATVDGAQVALAGAEVTVRDAEVTGVGLQLLPVYTHTFTLVGTQVQPDGQETRTQLAGVRLYVLDGAGNPVLDSATGEALTVQTDERARLTVTLPQGDYLLMPEEGQDLLAQYAAMGVAFSLPAQEDSLALPAARTRVVISAQSETGARLTGAVYALTDAAGNRVELTVDENGRAVSELLDAGEYTVSCVRAPGGYAGCADLTVSVRPGAAVQAQMTHRELGGLSVQVLLVHLSEAGEEVAQPVAGASLTLYALAAGGDPLNPDDFAPYPAEAPVTYTADAEGAISLRLPAGTYRLVLRADGQIENANDGALTFSVEDGVRGEAKMRIGQGSGGLEVYLEGEWTDQQTAQTAYALLPDADGDGVADADAQEIELAPAGSGLYRALNVEPGAYVLRQTLAPAGYGRADDLPVTVLPGRLAEASVTMLENATLRVSKTGITFNSDLQMFSVPLGAAYGVYTLDASGVYLPYPDAQDQAVIYANATAAQLEAGAQAALSLPARLEGTTYYLREIEDGAASGFVTDETYHAVTLYSGQELSASITGTSDRGFFQVTLSDAATGEPLAGGEFALYALHGVGAQLQPEQEPVLTFACSDGAYTNDAALPVGRYLLVQLAAPEGYMLDARVQETRTVLEITSYLATGDSVASVQVRCARTMQPTLGGEMTASLQYADGRANFELSGFMQGENAVPVDGAGLLVYGTDALDIERVQLSAATCADGRPIGARLVYHLREGGWRLDDVRTCDLSAEAEISLADVEDVVTAARVLYIDLQTGEEAAPAGLCAQGMRVEAALVSEADAQIQMNAQRLGTYTYADARGENEQTGTLDGQACSDMITGVVTQESIQRAQRAASLDAAVAGVVFDDADGDGWMRPQGQAGIEGAYVALLDTAGQVAAQTVTAADGAYRFEGLDVGTYRVQVSLPEGLRVTQRRDGLGGGAYIDELGLSEPFELTAEQAFAGVNVGALQGAAIRGEAFADANADGVRGADEAALAGVRVTLLDEAGAQLATVSTDESGAFYMDELFPGEYSLRFDAPDGYAAVGAQGLTVPRNGAYAQTVPATLTAGEVSLAYAAGFVRTGEVTGSVFLDADADGMRGAGEAAFVGVTVRLIRDVNGQAVQTAETTTDAQGEYAFVRVRAGEYRVLFELPEGYVFSRYAPEGGSDVYGAVTASGATRPFALEAGDRVEGMDAGATQPAALTVVCWQDTQYDGVMTASEIGLEGVRVTLTRLEDGVSGQELTLDTDAEGRAVFGAVSPGTYVLSYALPDAWRTTKNVEREGAIVSAVPMSADATGETEPFVLSMGQADAALYIGAMISGSIRGSAFADADDNGLWDAGEAALSGVQVDLLSASGEMIATTATDADGAYAFEGLAPGAYSVRFTARGRCFSGTSATASRGCAPRTDEEVSQTKELTVAMGGSLGDVDAGVVQTATVSGRIFEDSDGDGAMGASERMLPGVTAELIFVDSNRVLQQTVTASDGAFVFASVRPGSYSVRVTLPDGYVFTAGAPLESARDGEGTTAPVQVDAGAAVDALECGALIMGSVSGVVWDDADYNGLCEEDADGVRGAVIELLNADGNVVQTQTTLRTGAFAFEQLMPGSYSVRVTLPDGYVLTRMGDSAVAAAGERVGQAESFVLAMGEQRENVRMGGLEPASLEGKAWQDLNDDGRRGGSEPGMSGVQVSLWQGETLVAQTTTDETGAWRFDGVMPGEYALRAALPEGYAFARQREDGKNTSDIATVETLEGVSASFALESGRTHSAQIGVVGVGEVTGTVWLDSAYDGYMAAGESGVAGALAELLDEDGQALMQAYTDEHGRYAFTRVRTGVYSVRFVLPDGEIFTLTPEDGDSRVPQADQSEGQTAQMELQMGASIADVNAGVIIAGSIEGELFIDRDGDGLRAQGEEALGGALVELLQGGTVVASVSTDSAGGFAFTTLRPGAYRARISLPDGYLFGLNVALNLADPDDAQGETGELQLDMGCSIDGLSYPTLPEVRVGGRAWEDLNVDGLRGADEPVLAGTAVELLCRTDGEWRAVRACTVAEDGAYLFDRLRPGTYAVRFTLPSGYLFTDNAPDAADLGSDVAVVPGQTGTTAEMALSMGDAREHVDVGGIRPARLGDTVWLDENGNGLQDYGEAFVSDVQLELYAVGADGALTLTQSAVSDAYGRYRMDALRPGRYVLRAILPEGRAFAAAAQGMPEIDSDITSTGEDFGQTDVFTLGSGQTLLNVDVGLQ